MYPTKLITVEHFALMSWTFLYCFMTLAFNLLQSHWETIKNWKHFSISLENIPCHSCVYAFMHFYEIPHGLERGHQNECGHLEGEINVERPCDRVLVPHPNPNPISHFLSHCVFFIPCFWISFLLCGKFQSLHSERKKSSISQLTKVGANIRGFRKREGVREKDRHIWQSRRESEKLGWNMEEPISMKGP